MDKNQFLDGLKRELSGLPQNDVDERLSFYSEMIDDRMEEGLTEEEAVAEIGNAEDIASQIISETPLTKIVKEKIKPKRSLRAWEILLIVIGSPIWGALLIAALAIVFSGYVVLWSLIVSLWAVEVSFIAVSLACLASSAVFFIKREIPSALAMLGAGILFAGLSIFLFIGCVGATRGAASLTKKIAVRIKSLFVGKEKDHE